MSPIFDPQTFPTFASRGPQGESLWGSDRKVGLESATERAVKKGTNSMPTCLLTHLLTTLLRPLSVPPRPIGHNHKHQGTVPTASHVDDPKATGRATSPRPRARAGSTSSAPRALSVDLPALQAHASAAHVEGRALHEDALGDEVQQLGAVLREALDSAGGAAPGITWVPLGGQLYQGSSGVDERGRKKAPKSQECRSKIWTVFGPTELSFGRKSGAGSAKDHNI